MGASPAPLVVNSAVCICGHFPSVPAFRRATGRIKTFPLSHRLYRQCNAGKRFFGKHEHFMSATARHDKPGAGFPTSVRIWLRSHERWPRCLVTTADPAFHWDRAHSGDGAPLVPQLFWLP